MERIFFDLLNFAKYFTALGLNYYISVGVFALCMIAALFGLIDCSLKPKTNAFSIGLFVFYQAAFIVNAALCLSESVFVGCYFHTAASAYAFCFSQYAVCLVFWLMLYKDRKNVADDKVVLFDDSAECKKCKKCAIIDLYGDLLADLKQKNEALRGGGSDGRGFEDAPVTCLDNARFFDKRKNDFLSADERYPFEEDCEEVTEAGGERTIPDINVAYVSNLVNALLSKNIQPDEREKLQDLNLKLKSLPSDAKEVSELNGLLRFLLKKIAEYDISA